MDANQIEKLKALALAADREEWMTSDGDATVYGEDGDSVCVCHTNIGKMPDPVFAVDRAKFIAEANPAAVLELIAEVERLRAAPAAGTVKDAGWIDLKKDKPMDWQRVLVALDSGAVVEGYRGSAGWHWGETDEPQDGDANAIYWMPWPESPVAATEATKAGKDNA